jgi:aspartate carbamoyltransferase regulatory subunit
MTEMTPAQERYTRFACPNPQCTWFNRLGEGNIAHRSWTGTHKHIERLRCTACDREFSHSTQFSGGAFQPVIESHPR